MPYSTSSEIPRERRTTTGVSVRPEHSWSGSRWERKGWRALELRLGEVLEIREPGTGLKDQPAPSAFAAPMVATPAAMTRSGEPTPRGSTSTPARSTCSARSR